MIWVFWCLTVLMVALAVAVVVWPLWRNRAGDHSRRADNIAIYRERIAELDAEAAAGRLPALDAERFRAELGRRLLAETRDAPAAERRQSTSGKFSWRVSAVLAVLVPALAFGLYWAGGDWQLAGRPPPALPYLAKRLQQRLQASPDEPEGWLLLGRVRDAQQQYAAAAKAYARANALGDRPDPKLLVLEGEARTMANGGMAAGKPRTLFEQALKLDPDDGTALWYGGLGAVQSGDRARARVLWTRLSKQKLPDKFRRLLERALSRIAKPTQAPAKAG